MEKIGVLSLTGNGQVYDVMEGTTHSVQTEEIETFRTQNSVTKARVKPVSPFVQATVSFGPGQGTKDFQDFSGDVELRLRNGVTVLLEDAVIEGRPEADDDQGTAQVRWVSQSAREY